MPPVVAVVGVWDPITSAHTALIRDLTRRGKVDGLGTVAILIDPAPASIADFAQRYGTHGWPVFDGVAARTLLLRDLGVEAVLVARFARHDFTASAAEFLDQVRSQVAIRELWLGATQNLGPGPAGGRDAVTRYVDSAGLALRLLPRPPVSPADVRVLLATGCVQAAAAMAGRSPTWRRPASGHLRLAWRPGPYRAFAVERPAAPGGEPLLRSDFDLVLEARSGAPGSLAWPRSTAPFIAITHGPADDPRSGAIGARSGVVPR